MNDTVDFALDHTRENTWEARESLTLNTLFTKREDLYSVKNILLYIFVTDGKKLHKRTNVKNIFFRYKNLIKYFVKNKKIILLRYIL